MAYHTFAASEYDPESPITTSFMSNLIGNFMGLVNGDAGTVIETSALNFGLFGRYLGGTTGGGLSNLDLDSIGITSTHPTLYLELDSVRPDTNGQVLYMRWGEGATPTWLTGNYYRYSTSDNRSNALTSTWTVLPIITSTGACSSTGNLGCQGGYWFNNFPGTATYPYMHGSVMYYDTTAGNFDETFTRATYDDTGGGTDCTGWRVYSASGNISGTLRAWEIEYS